MIATAEERLFTMLISEAEDASTELARGTERDELCTAILGLRSKLARIQSQCDGRIGAGYAF